MIKRGRPKGSKNRLKTAEDDENVVRYLLRYLRRLDEAFEQIGELTAQMTSIIRQLDRIENNQLSRPQEAPPNSMARRRDRDDDLQPKLVSVAKAQGILGVGRSTIDKLIAQKKLKTVDDVGAKRIVRESIDDYITNSQGNFHPDQGKADVANPQPQDDDRVLTFQDLKANKNWPYTAEHTRRLILAGKFPKPFKSGESGKGGLNLWFESVIDRYISERARSRKKSRP